MTKNVLLLGLNENLIRDFTKRVGMSDIELFGGTGLDDLRSVLARTHIDHVLIGGGIDLNNRLEIIREIFHSSDKTTAHMKDQISGPEGFVPFARAVLSGLKDYEFVASANARSEIKPSKQSAELFIVARFHAREGAEDAIEAALREEIPQARDDPGCLAIDAYRSTRDPRLFFIHSRWTDESAFEEHAKTQHTVQFISRVVPVIDHALDVNRASLLEISK